MSELAESAVPAPRGSRSRGVALALGIPHAIAATMALLMRTTPVSLVAPLLGPWTGIPYGHRECTMASAMPTASACCVAGIALAGGLHFALRRTRFRPLSLALLARAASAWSVLALFSVVNTLS